MTKKSSQDRDTEIHDLTTKLTQEIELGKDDERNIYAIVNHHESGSSSTRKQPLRMSSTEFRLWVKQRARNLGIRLTHPEVMHIVGELESAPFSTIKPICICMRTAYSDGSTFIDIGDSDHSVIEISPSEVTYVASGILEERRTFFAHPAGYESLPVIDGHASDLEALRAFMNLPEGDDAWRLLVAFILYALRPKGPYPILLVGGSAGSAKSSFCNNLKKLIDPSKVASQSIPKSLQDLMIAAKNSHLLVFDNVSSIRQEMSDAFCRIATGGGMRTRKLFHDADETLFQVTRPIILNGIGNFGAKSDLLSRSIYFDLPPISSKARRTIEELENCFEKAMPNIFAGMLSALSETLKARASVSNIDASRMADFDYFGVAVEKALGWPDGSFLSALTTNRREMMDLEGDENPLVDAMRRVATAAGLGKDRIFTLDKLLDELSQHTRSSKLFSPKWLGSAKSLGRQLRAISPQLEAHGIALNFDRGVQRTVRLVVSETASCLPPLPNHIIDEDDQS